MTSKSDHERWLNEKITEVRRHVAGHKGELRAYKRSLRQLKGGQSTNTQKPPRLRVVK